MCTTNYFFFLFVWLLVKLLSQSINKTIGSYKETVWSLQRCIKTKIWHTKHQFSHPPLPFTLTARLRGNWGCLPFHQKTRLVDRCGKWEASKPIRDLLFHLQFQAIQSERPGTGQKERMERTISVRKFRLGILVHLSRNPVFPGNFPFGKTKLVFPFTFQPKFPDFFCKW